MSEPLVSVLIGITVLGEQVRTGVLGGVVARLFGAIAVGGTIAVDRSEAVAALQAEEELGTDSGGSAVG